MRKERYFHWGKRKRRKIWATQPKKQNQKYFHLATNPGGKKETRNK
jgi:hypothetical protein